MSDYGHRRSIRLQEYDYAQDGAYYITICSYQRKCIFGEIVESTMHLSDIGEIIEEEWLHTEQLRAEISLDYYVVMPNHFHAIIVLDQKQTTNHNNPDNGTKTKSISALIQGFKSAVTARVNKIQQATGTTIWQRNYYEHIIRNEKSLNAIREYIVLNPAKWAEDKENPKNIL